LIEFVDDLQDLWRLLVGAQAVRHVSGYFA
jgi:hypothetical protein